MCASSSRTALLALVAMTLLAAPACAAEKKPDPAKEQARRLQLANRKLEQEKSLLAKEKTEIETRLKETEDKIGAAQGQAAGAERRASLLGKELAALRSEKDSLTGKLAETAEQLRNESDARKRLETLAAQQKQSIGQCEALNARMHAEGVALLEKYRNKSCMEAVLQADPFTGLKQVEVENFVEDSRDKLDELRIDTQARR